jgi:hypothetical protein
MSNDLELARALAAVAATLNHEQLERWDPDHVRRALRRDSGGAGGFAVDDRGVLTDDRGRKVGRIRRAGLGTWFIERRG